MNVEVEVVRAVRTTYLVENARSLEHAERAALDVASKRLAARSGVTKSETRKAEHWVQWSQPVLVRDGKVVRG